MEMSIFLLPLLIFVARVADVSLGTIRVIFVSKGFKFLAPLLGFFEILIWIIAIKNVMVNDFSLWMYLAYAGGFAVGNYVGICIEDYLSIGKVMIRIITQKDAGDLIQNLKDDKYPVTVIDGKGRDGDVKMIFSVVDKSCLKRVVGIIKKYNPKAFYSIEDLRFAANDNDIFARPKRVFLQGGKRKGK